MVAFVTAAYLVLILIVARAGQLAPGAAPRPDRRAWAAFVVLMALATYSSFVAVLVVPAQLLALLPRRRRAHVRPFIFSFVAYAVLCVPLFVLAVRRGSGQLFWVPRPTHKIEVQVLQELTSAGLQPSFHRTATTTPLLIATVAAVIAIAGLGGAVVVAARKQLGARGRARLAGRPGRDHVRLLADRPAAVSAAQCPDGGARGSAAAGRRARASRAPEVRRAGRARRAGRPPGVAARRRATAYRPSRGSRRAAYVQASARPGDCIAFYPLDGRMAFQYYIGTEQVADASAPRSILPVANWGTVTPYVEQYATLAPAQIARRTADCRRLWFVSSHEGQLDGPAQSLANRARYVALRGRLARRFGHAPIKKFGYAAAVHVQLFTRHPGTRQRSGTRSK